MTRKLLALLPLLLPLGASAEEIRLYPDGIPGLPAAEPKIVASKDDVIRITNVSSPFVKVVRPERPNGWGVIICPGGGYTILAVNKEGDDVAAVLAEKGFTSYVLRYRVTDGTNPAYRDPGPLQDARRALAIAREDGAKHGVKPDRIGVIGFSAGGHLAGLLATDTPATGREGPGVAFGALIYPVVSFSEPWTHGGSRARMLGSTPSEEDKRRLSVEKRLDAKETPPLFLVHGQFDGGVPVKNSIALAEEATRLKIPVSLHVFPISDHGFGLGRPGKTDPAYAWPELFMTWVLSLK